MPAVIYSPRYRIDLGLHVFPTEKYRRIHDRLLDLGLIRPADIVEPPAATWEELALVHTSDYLDRMRDGTMTADDIMALELPWSREMVEGFRVMVGGSIQAALIACGLATHDGTQSAQSRLSENFSLDSASSAFDLAVHLGGGLHHAFPNHGEGFCPFNDVAVAVRVLQSRGIERAAVVDLDVHHGNGTAFIFESDPRVFTFSMHQQHNYPMWKPRGSLDIGLADGTHDAAYLEKLEAALPAVVAHRPDCVFYLAGADPYEDDQLGGLRLTKDGLRQRDRLVVQAVRAAGVPMVITLAGGYARHVDDTVAIHCATVKEAFGGAA